MLQAPKLTACYSSKHLLQLDGDAAQGRGVAVAAQPDVEEHHLRAGGLCRGRPSAALGSAQLSRLGSSAQGAGTRRRRRGDSSCCCCAPGCRGWGRPGAACTTPGPWPARPRPRAWSRRRPWSLFSGWTAVQQWRWESRDEVEQRAAVAGGERRQAHRQAHCPLPLLCRSAAASAGRGRGGRPQRAATASLTRSGPPNAASAHPTPGTHLG